MGEDKFLRTSNLSYNPLQQSVLIAMFDVGGGVESTLNMFFQSLGIEDIRL